jgi:hypothetical protein
VPGEDRNLLMIATRGDFKERTPRSATAIMNVLLSRTHERSIVQMHDGGGDRSQTVQALQTILPNLKSRFTLIPLPTRSGSGARLSSNSDRWRRRPCTVVGRPVLLFALAAGPERCSRAAAADGRGWVALVG